MNRDLPVLLVEDDLALREALAETLRLADYDVRLAEDGTSALEVLRKAPVSAIVTDYQMEPMDGYELLCRVRENHPQLPVLLMTAHGSIEHAVRSMLEGATDYLVKPFSAPDLTRKLHAIIPEFAGGEAIVAEDPATYRVLELARKVAASDATVLLTGESGTGKEVFAQFIHEQSARADDPFVAINCAAIPENMLEAVLFGHEKGAFTGAHESRTGKFEQAQGGTLLLDEISEMAPALQAKLLRVIQEKEVEKIGGRQSISLDVRILATTNKDLAEQVKRGEFREDLFYRLSVFPIALPPLRERPQDIIPLAQHFAADAGGPDRPAPKLNTDATTALLNHHWPGNVRELQNLVHRAAILCSGGQIRARDLRFENLPEDVAAEQPAATEAVEVTADESGLQRNMQTVESQLILNALNEGHGSRKKAAEILGISPRTLRYKIARLREAGVKVPGHRDMTAMA